MQRNLSIYSASAGSGKTYTIAYEYISMMLSAVSDTTFRNILAVTFTNKACDEMKSRIVLNLFLISNIDKATGSLKKKTEGIIGKIKEKTGLSEDFIIKRSRSFFTQIIHDYSFFSVYTIDKFFQKIIRNLTYELDLQQNYEPELNTDLVISQLVDDIMLLAEGDDDLNKSISSMIEENIEADKKWSPKAAIKGFIKKAVEANVNELGCNVNAYEEKIDKIISDFCTKFRTKIDSIRGLINANGLNDDDFSHASGGIYSKYKQFSDLDSKKSKYIDIIAEKFSPESFLKDDWFKKGSKNAGLASQFKSLADEISNLDSDYERFCTAYVLKKNMNLLRLLGKATEILHETLNRDSLFLLSDVPSLLSEIIKRSSDDSGNVSVMPFVFESIGTKYNNFMIDEFQDTSRQQWDIFQTMLHDALSQGNESIVVGDIKQSIYSWRGGDWRILSKLANKDSDEILSNFCELKNLGENYRTAKDIVEFNNDFFYYEYKNNESLFGDTAIDSQFLSLYDDVWQNVTDNTGSEIKIRLYSGPYKISDEVAMKRSFDDMVAEIEKLQQEYHVPPSKIKILVRETSEASFVANSFLGIAEADRKKGVRYDVVSNEALYLASNRAVKIILAFMRHILNSNDKISLVVASYLYFLEKNKGITGSEFNKKDMVDSFVNVLGSYESLSDKQSFEIVEIMIDRLKLNTNKSNVPFLIAFRNVVHNFSERSTALQAFIDYWDERGFMETLKIPESQNAMQVITIHKSKGLEADYIFIPFCNWEFVKNIGTEYMFVPDPIDNGEFLVPVANNSFLAKTSLASEYKANNYRKVIESYNLLYVAFTRAKYGLYVSAYEMEATAKDDNKRDKSLSRVSQFLADYFSDESLDKDIVSPTKKELLRKRRDGWDFDQVEAGADNIKTRLYTKGRLTEVKGDDKQKNDDSFITEYPVCESPQMGIVHHIRENVDGDWSARVRGTKYHAIFEHIITIDDVEPAVAQMFNSGEIDSYTYKNLVGELGAALSCEPIAKWFDGTSKVYNEFNIIDPAASDYKLKRPDRVMVFPDEVVILDYKFGEETHNRTYAKQVLHYAELISEMKQFTGMKVSAYIWYYFRNELVKVDSLEKTETINMNN